MPLKERVCFQVQRFHNYLLSSSLARIYCYFVLTYPKVKRVEIHGSECYFVIGTSYHSYYVKRFSSFASEIPTQKYLLKHLEMDDAFFDVGANIGAYVVWLAKAGKLRQVVAFEPASVNHATLVRSVAINGFSNVLCLPVAASSDSGYEKLWVGGSDAKTLGYLDSYATKPSCPSFEIVRKERIDDLIEAGLINAPSVVLIDVDGGEIEVLRGMSRALEDCRIVIVEVSPATESVVHEIHCDGGFSLEVDKPIVAGKPKRVGNRVYRR